MLVCSLSHFSLLCRARGLSRFRRENQVKGLFVLRGNDCVSPENLRNVL
jgi:hypothetical protein